MINLYTCSANPEQTGRGIPAYTTWKVKQIWLECLNCKFRINQARIAIRMIKIFLFSFISGSVWVLSTTFGGMWRWRRVAVARVFALVVRWRDMMVITLFSRWQKPWHQEGVPGGSRGRPWRKPQNRLFSYPIVAPRSANDIYRPVSPSELLS